ncbi:MAG: Por secretion system C-terminal sorting protein, partial [Verrucomicrobiales bacterium]|nr:Por secretion system C-terminal sorting protein [Verrucomicrobiales bacterium]
MGSPSIGVGILVTLNDGTVLGFGDGSTNAQLFGAVAVHAVGSGAAATYQITDGVLPRGLALTTAGVLVGSPFQLGDFTFTITATDGAGCTGAGTVSMVVKS